MVARAAVKPAVCLEPIGIIGRELAAKLDAAASTVNLMPIGASGGRHEVAPRLSRSPGRSPGSWLLLQYSYVLSQARQRVDLRRVGKVRLTVA